ncbi:hypothetical protein LIER_21590 [Lithospermum erythrorhizon]|uniref:Uncharacterized protein n=1 Tax=Lithospermum erythrorhizon TaxID=34254 RepID=A0AAV3QWJ1_LITER
MFRDFIQEGALLDLDFVDTEANKTMYKRRFVFDRRWVEKEGCEEVIRATWSISVKGSRWFQVCKKVKNVKLELISWCRKNNFNSQVRIDDLQTMIKKVYDEVNLNRDDLVYLEKELEIAWGEEEIYWKTRSRDQHLKEGDKNINFFHASTILRRRQNNILGIEDKGGSWKEGPEEVEKIVFDYFEDIFSANGVCEPELAVSDLQGRVTTEMN